MSELTRRQQARKDPRALGQNLYDSLSMIYSYTKQIPNSASVLASLDPSHGASSQDGDCSRPSLSEGGSSAEHLSNPNQSTGPALANGKPRTANQHSQPKARTHDNVTTGNTTAQVVRNGQQIHRIPYHPPNSLTRKQSTTATDATPTDGTPEPTMLSISKSGRKSFTIGGMKPATPSTKTTASNAETPKKEPINGVHANHGVYVLPILSCSIMDEFKEQVRPRGRDRPAYLNIVHYDAHSSRPTKPIVNRSLFYALSDPETLLLSFHDSNQAFKDSPLPHLDSHRLVNSFRDWSHRNGALIFDSLWLALEAVFVPPPELGLHKSPRLKPSRKGASSEDWPEETQVNKKAILSRYLSTQEAAHIVMICIHALTSSVPIGSPHVWAQIRKLRSWGIIIPHEASDTGSFTQHSMDIIDALEHEPAFRLANRLCRAIGMRCCFEHILGSLNPGDAESPATDQSLLHVLAQHLEVVERVELANKRILNPDQDMEGDPGWTVSATFMEWLRSVIIKEWDSKAEINKWSSVGSAVITLDNLCKSPEHCW